MNKYTTPKKEEVATWAWIKHRLALQGYTLRSLARNYGVNKYNFIKVKHYPYPKYEKIIADLLGDDPWDLWPHRYGEDHKPNRISIKFHPEQFYRNRTIKQNAVNVKGVGTI